MATNPTPRSPDALVSLAAEAGDPLPMLGELGGYFPANPAHEWENTRRADRYRAFKQIPGIDPEPVEMTSTATDRHFTFTALITIVSVNDA